MIVRTAGLVGLAAVALMLAACSSTGGGTGQDESSSVPTPAAPQSTSEPAAAKPKVSNPFQSKGFTIRYLDQGKVKQIDVPDFKH